MILILTQCFPPEVGGIQNLMGGLAEALGQTGYRAVTIADSTSGDRVFEAGFRGVAVYRFGGPRPLRRRLKAWKAGQLIVSESVDAIFCDSWKSIELLAQGPVPVAVMAHGAEFPDAPSERKKRRISRALRKAHVVIANSHYTAELAQLYLPPETLLTVVHPPVHPQPAPTRAALERLAALTRGARPLLAGLARLEPRKGFDRAIEALARLAHRFPRIGLVIGGSGEDASRLQSLAEKVGVAERLHLLGRIDSDEKAALLSSADLFVMPTRREGSSVEGFGIVYAEAAWYGVPSLAGSDGGGGDAVVHGETGLVVPGDNQEAVEAAIGDLLVNDVRRKAMGEAARARVQRIGVWESALPLYLGAVLPS